MKRFFSILVVFLLLFVFISNCFAETADFYNNRSGTVLVDDGRLAGGPPILPKTGGIPPEAFYVAGVLIIVSAVALSLKGKKAKATKG